MKPYGLSRNRYSGFGHQVIIPSTVPITWNVFSRSPIRLFNKIPPELLLMVQSENGPSEAIHGSV